MKITVVRHGETNFNKDNLIQGHSNIYLNDNGRRQAKKLRGEIFNNKYDICYMSPLLRTVETAFILVGDRVKTITDDRLIERFMGDIEGKSRFSYDGNIYWDYNLNCNDRDVEPIQDIFKRCRDFLNDILKENYDSVLIVTHSAVFRVIHHILLNSDTNKKLPYFKIGNCSIEEFEVNKKRV